MANIEKVSTEKHEGDATCLVYHNNQVLSGGADGKVKIWDNDLNPIKTVDAHEAYIYAMAVGAGTGKVYSSSCDGCVKFMLPPYERAEPLFSCENAIQALYCDDDVLYTGDDKGVITHWEHDKIKFKFNLVEEVKSLAVEQALIYSVRDLDVVVSEVVAGKSGKYSIKAVMPGKSPLALVGPLEEGKRTFLAFADRTGKGLALAKNLPQQLFASVWNLPDCHEMIVLAMCGDDKCLYSGGYDNKVRGWTNLEHPQPRPLGVVNVGSCVNAICCGVNNSVYIASSDGVIRRAKFLWPL